MPNIGPMEIVLLLLLALLLFGAKRLPEIGRSLGSGMREFKDSVSGDKKPEPETRSELPPPVAAPSDPAPSDPVPSDTVPQAADATEAPQSAPEAERETEPVS
jgi:sec-independent protein translocase protein TatA